MKRPANTEKRKHHVALPVVLTTLLLALTATVSTKGFGTEPSGLDSPPPSITAPDVHKQGSPSVQPEYQLSDDDADLPPIRKKLLRLFGNRLTPEQRERLRGAIEPDPNKSAEEQPYKAYRSWALAKRPFVPTFLLFFLAAIAANAFFSNQVKTAQSACRRQFWHCIGKGVLSMLLLVLAAKILAGIQFVQLASVTIAAVQFLLLAGLCVSISLLGTKITEKTGLAASSWFLSHPRMGGMLQLFIGSLLIAATVLIPTLGQFPQVGIRITLLVAILGTGGLLKTRLGTRSTSSTE